MKYLFHFMTTMLCCVVVLQSKAAVVGKTSLSGTITEKATGQPVPGAEVYIPDLHLGAISQMDGTYRIDDLPAAKLLVRISMVGYSTVTRTVDLAMTQTLDVALEPSVTEIGEVVVTGTSKATALRRDPVPTVLVGRQVLEQNTATNAIDALRKVPGVSTLTTGPNVSKPYIRGLGYNRVLTLFDGVRQEGQQWGDEHGVEIDQFLIDRIEVVKGPASLMYGSDALAGVVNLLPAPTAPKGTVRGSVLGDYQMNNKQIAGSVALDGNNNGFVWGLRGSHKQAADYQNRDDGRVFGTKFNENDLNVYGGVDRSWGFAHLDFGLYDNKQEIPDGSRDSTSRRFTAPITEADTVRRIVPDDELSSYAIGTVHQRVLYYRLYSTNNFILGRQSIGLLLAYQQSARREFSHPTYPDLPGLYLILKTFSYDLKYHLPEFKLWALTVGANGMVQDNDAAKGTEMVIPSYKDLDVGPFIHVRRPFGKVDLSGGIRYDIRRFRNEDMYTRPDPTTGFDMATDANNGDTTVVKQFDAYDHTFTGMSGSLGLAYNMNDRLTLKANIARGYRAPNAAEISAKGVHPGTGFEQLGNANFEPEFNLQEDVGAYYAGTHVSFSIELFNNVISNYIYNEKLLSTNGGDSLFTQDGEDYEVFKFRQTRAQLYGGELSIDIHPHPWDWLHFENSLSYINAENLGGNGAEITDSTKYLPFIPPMHTNSELRADLRKRVGPFSNVFIKVGMQVYADQDHYYGAYGTETFTPGYTLFDAGVGGDVVDKEGNVLFKLSILGSNITDVAYQSNMSRSKYMDDYPVNGTGRSGIYEMGRNITFKVVVPFTLRRPTTKPATP
ncbi:MAG: TonB-dependent receptor [Flavobacteriales bacterium]|nr:TonB-dependent receptor [Flavobacteriales bacterium]